MKISNRTAVKSSTKLPVTYLTTAPFQGADSNIHRYKEKQKEAQKILERANFAVDTFGKTDSIKKAAIGAATKSILSKPQAAGRSKKHVRWHNKVNKKSKRKTHY